MPTTDNLGEQQCAIVSDSSNITDQTMDDGTVTIRYRDTQKQDRYSVENILKIIQDSLL